jgi:triosephosphate isomerase
MKRTPLIAGNWKMYLDLEASLELARAIVACSAEISDREVMIAPSFPVLGPVAEILRGSRVQLAGQNVCWEDKGAYTGEVSPTMLTSLGCSMAIIGHSERRHIFSEDDITINQRVLGALRYGLVPVLCVGETLDEREEGTTLKVLEEQLCRGLEGVDRGQAEKVVVAYEPVWAIGTGKTASPEQAQEAHHFLREMLSGLYEKNIAEQIRILYGGSVKPDNVDALMAKPDIDGALVGGASLKADTFEPIITFTK